MSDAKPPPPATKPAMPAQPATKQLPAMTDRALLEDLARVVKAGFEAQDMRLDNIERQVDIAVQDGRENNQRITRLEVRFDESDKRSDTRSVRVRQTSENDLKQDAAIANVITRLGTVEANQEKAAVERAQQTEMLARNNAMTEKVEKLLTGAARHPAVVALVFAVLGFLTAWFKGHTP